MSVPEYIRRADPADLVVALIAAGFVVAGIYETGQWAIGAGETPAAILLSVLGVGLFASHYRAEIKPEHDTTCAVCDAPIHVDSAEDGFDAALRVETADSPDRANLGWVSLITHRDRFQEVVCSGDCADRLVAEYREFSEFVSRDESSNALAEVSD